MAGMNLLGLGVPHVRPDTSDRTETIVIQRVLDRILAFTALDIDDVVNSPIAKNTVLGYFKLHRQVQRRCEIVELERQWNHT
jgi:hypothetical protein